MNKRRQKLPNSSRKLIPLSLCFPPGNAEFQACADTVIEDFGDLMDMIIAGISYFIGISTLVAVILIVYAGYMYIISAGDAEKASRATKIITNTIIGLIIIWLSGMIIQFVLDRILI